METGKPVRESKCAAWVDKDESRLIFEDREKAEHYADLMQN